MLIVVKHRNIALFDQGAFDFEAFRRLDIFEVDPPESDGNALDGIDEGLRALSVHFDIEHIDAGETLEQYALSFHYRL